MANEDQKEARRIAEAANSLTNIVLDKIEEGWDLAEDRQSVLLMTCCMMRGFLERVVAEQEACGDAPKGCLEGLSKAFEVAQNNVRRAYVNAELRKDEGGRLQ